MEFVVVLERWRKDTCRSPRLDRSYAKRARSPRRKLGVQVRRGTWDDTVHSYEAALFESIAVAKRVAKASLISVMIAKGYRFSVHVVRERRPVGRSGRLFARLITSEVWPEGNPIDALAAVGANEEDES